MNDPQLVQLVQPPHSLEAEQSVIGAILLDNNAFERVVDVVSGDDFYRDDHRRIWRHISRLIVASRPADLVTLSESITSSEDKNRTGGPEYLAQLTQNTPSALNVRRYAEIVREKSIRRRLAQAGTEIAEAAMAPTTVDVGMLTDEAESKIFQVSEASVRRGEGPKEIGGLLSKVFERLDHLHSQGNPSDVTGVSTGFADLDAKLSGLQPTDLIVLAGRPSMGKTAMALNIVEHVALKLELPVVVFSMEMSGQQLSQRMLSSVAKVDAQKLRNGRLSHDEWSVLTEGMSKLHAAPIHIDDAGALTALEIRARARRIKRQFSKLGLVVVDYLQLMQGMGRDENRATEISEISRSLKALAKELEVPVLALSQLSRKCEERTDKRPVLADLRESGAIEQDADVVLFIYRHEVYFPDDEEAKGRAEVIIGKQRNGPIGYVDLTFLGRYTLFTNYGNPAFDGGRSSRPGRSTRAKVRNFNDYKSAAAGPDA